MKNKVINLLGKPQVVQNQGKKYSELLEQFIAPFIQEFADVEYQDEVLDFAINAWNIANIKALIPEGEINNAMDAVEAMDVDFDLLNRMIDYKLRHFKTYTNFIVEFELRETSGDPILSVITQEEGSFLANMAENFEDGQNEDNFEENYIDRTVLMLRPLQPFIDWLTNLYPDEINNFNDYNSYLINEDIDVEAWIKKKFDKLFMMELEAWHTNKKEWPQKRNYKMFKQWFQVDISTMVYDLEKYPVSKFE